MELPFAVESSADPSTTRSSLQHSDSSLVTASSQGSCMASETLDIPLPPNTPQDVVLPRYDNRQPQAALPGHQQEKVRNVSSPLMPHTPQDTDEPEVIDFTYVNVSETDADVVDILLEGGDLDIQTWPQRGDILTVLLGGIQPNGNVALADKTDEANKAASQAAEAKKRGDLLSALDHHTKAAKHYRELALAVSEQNSSLANSLLLLSQTQAKSALALKGIVKLNLADLKNIFPPSSKGTADASTATMSQQERLRAAVRGALGSRHPHEADISDSQFLGRATSGPSTGSTTLSPSSQSRNTEDSTTSADKRGTLLSEGQDPANRNPVDEMMELERELRDMDMALELGNSISSIDARMQNRMKNSMIDGSFMVVPPGSNSYMSSSMWGSGNVPNNPRSAPQPNNSGTAGVRARANRVQNRLEASAATANRPTNPVQQVGPPAAKNSAGLESSWWGNASTTSQVLASSVISLGSRVGGDGGNLEGHGGQPANTKQLMRLMDSLKTLGDENAALLREVEEAEAARLEAKTAREEMKKFKAEYGARFSSLKKALEKFRREHPQGEGGANNPVNSSEFVRTASVTDQLQRKEQLIRKLTADLKKEKEESKRKDQALRKYEGFYREVKARSALKAAQKTQQRQHKSPRKLPTAPHK